MKLRERLADVRHPYRVRDRLDNERIRLLISYVLTDDGVGVDVGAHVGTFTREMVRCAPHGHVIAVEPVPFRAEALAAMWPTLQVVRGALSDVNGTAEFAVADQDAMSSLVVDRTTHNGVDLTLEIIQVETWTLDQILDGRRADVIKIDAEESEVAVLRGAVETLARGTTVVIEHGAGARAEHDEIFSVLSSAGLRLFTIDGDGPYETSETFAERSNVGDLWTWVAHR